MKEKEHCYELDGELFTLEDSIDLLAIGICENLAKKEKRTKDILVKCKILDSLSNALSVIKK